MREKDVEVTANERLTGNSLKGIQWSLLFSVTAPTMAVLAKCVSEGVSGAQISFIRFVLQATILFWVLLFIGQLRLSGLARASLPLHLARGAAIGAASACMYQGVKLMDIADAVAVLSLEPLLMALASRLIYGERIGPRRLAASLTGLVGAMLLIQPSFAEVGWAILLPIASAILAVVYAFLTRRLAGTMHVVAMQFYAGLGASLFLFCALFIYWLAGKSAVLLSTPTQGDWLYLATIGLLASLTHILFVFAFQAATVGTLAPFQYMQIAVASVLGYFIFSEVPNQQELFAIFLIVGAGIYMFYREYRNARMSAAYISPLD